MLILFQETEPWLLRLEISWKTCLHYVFSFSHVLLATFNWTHSKLKSSFALESFVQVDHQSPKETGRQMRKCRWCLASCFFPICLSRFFFFFWLICILHTGGSNSTVKVFQKVILVIFGFLLSVRACRHEHTQKNPTGMHVSTNTLC